MTEADLKRALVKSIRAQGGIGYRIEDRFKVGWPDMIMIPVGGPVFFAEAKLIKGAKLVCTELQEERLKELWRPPHALSCILGFKGGMLYCGFPEEPLVDCDSVFRPQRLDGDEWWITELLIQFEMSMECGTSRGRHIPEPSR